MLLFQIPLLHHRLIFFATRMISCAELRTCINYKKSVTLNKVSDEEAVNILRKFLDNAKKRSKDFEYVWIAERQTKNDAFKGMFIFI